MTDSAMPYRPACVSLSRYFSRTVLIWKNIGYSTATTP